MALDTLAVIGVESISIDGGDGELTLVFNTTPEHPLSDLEDAVAAKWTLRYQNVFSAGIDIARTDYNKAVLFVTPSEIDPGPDVLNYSNAPSDVSDGLGRELAAFEDRPL